MIHSRHVCSLPGTVVKFLSQSPHLRACKPMVSSTLLPKASVYPLHPLRFLPLAQVINDVVKLLIPRFSETELRMGSRPKCGVPRVRVAHHSSAAWLQSRGDVNQLRAKANTAAIKFPQLRDRSPASGMHRNFFLCVKKSSAIRHSRRSSTAPLRQRENFAYFEAR